jgi:hypothetical protein
VTPATRSTRSQLSRYDASHPTAESTAAVERSESTLMMGSWCSDGHQNVRPPPGAGLRYRGDREPAGHARRIYALDTREKTGTRTTVQIVVLRVCQQ